MVQVFKADLIKGWVSYGLSLLVLFEVLPQKVRENFWGQSLCVVHYIINRRIPLFPRTNFTEDRRSMPLGRLSLVL